MTPGDGKPVSPLRIGLLGLGFMGKRHLEAYAALPEAEVFTRSHPRFAHIGSGDDSRLAREMIEDPSLDAIDICLPTFLHCSTAVAALEAGKTVICEKPMALSPAECSLMLQASERSTGSLTIAHVLRFWPAYRRLSGLVRSQERGAVSRVSFRRRSAYPAWGPWLRKRGLSGGAVLDLLVHDFDQSLALFGPPRFVTAARLPGADAIRCLLEYDCGAQVEIEGGWFEGEEPFSMSFRATAAEGEVVFEEDRLRFISSRAAAEEAEEIELSAEDPYTAQLRHFLACCPGRHAAFRPPKHELQAAVHAAAQAVDLALAVDAISREEPGCRQPIFLASPG